MRRRIRNKLNTKRRRRAAVVALAACALALVGGAYAYFSSTGTDTGQGKVGTSTLFTVTVDPAVGTMFPGDYGTSTLGFTITNPGTGTQRVAAVVADVASTGPGGDVTSGGGDVPGCLAAWFHVTVADNPAPTTLDPGSSATGHVDVQMSDPDTNQDACKGAQPDIVVSAS